MNRKEAVGYLREVFGPALGENLAPAMSDISPELMSPHQLPSDWQVRLTPAMSDISPELLSPFGRVLIGDSTQITLHEKLAGEFRGSGGSASISALRADLIYEARQNVVRNILISGGNVPDQSRADEILSGIRENDLILRDLGYFSVRSLREVGEKDAFFLSRLPKSVSVFLSDDRDASPVSLPGYVGRKFGNLPVTDMSIWVGDRERLPCRLVAYRLPDDVVANRRRKARRDARKKGRQPSEEYMSWLRFGFYVTNVPSDIWNSDIIGTVYRLRWQIELIFKYWKSLIKINIIRGTRRERAECFLYGRLISVAVATMICGFASWHAYACLRKEAGFHKIIRWLIRKDRLSVAIRSENMSGFFDDLRRKLEGDVSLPSKYIDSNRSEVF